MSASAVEIRNLVVCAGKRRLLDLPHLCVPAGEITAVMGQNGAGKTTLLRVCLGLLPSARGEVRVLDCSVLELRSGGLAQLRRRVGYMAQWLPSRNEIPLTVREVVAIGRTGRAGLFRPLNRADWRIVDEWTNRLGLAEWRNRPFSEISAGEQRKTIMAQAMAQEPELLLLDEPAANLDLGWRERIMEIIQQLQTSMTVTIMLVCHELEALPPACRNVVLLNHGQVLTLGSPENVLTSERVASLYGANLRVLHQDGRHAVVPGGGRHV
jgi:ABC-type Mn2+/Zn2+ transport system ATPase subunit